MYICKTALSSQQSEEQIQPSFSSTCNSLLCYNCFRVHRICPWKLRGLLSPSDQHRTSAYILQFRPSMIKTALDKYLANRHSCPQGYLGSPPLGRFQDRRHSQSRIDAERGFWSRDLVVRRERSGLRMRRFRTTFVRTVTVVAR